MTGILLDDVFSNFKMRKSDKEFFYQYGRKGEKVDIIADHGNVLIVQSTRERFTALKSKIHLQQ